MQELTPEQLAVFGAGVCASQPGSFGLDRISAVKGPDGTALRVSYPKGSSSQASHRNHGSPSGGAQVYLPFTAGPTTRMSLSYDVFFPPGFDFVKGGKLPGLYGGAATDKGHIPASGGRIPNGTDGLSTRLMWRTAGAGEVYAYLPTSVAHGTSLERGSWYWQPGQWEHVEEYVQLNEPGHSDGQILVWINAKLVIDQTALVFRTVDSLQIVGIFFSTFFGGSDPSWASPRDQYVEFANFALSAAGPTGAARPAATSSVQGA